MNSGMSWSWNHHWGPSSPPYSKVNRMEGEISNIDTRLYRLPTIFSLPCNKCDGLGRIVNSKSARKRGRFRKKCTSCSSARKEHAKIIREHNLAVDAQEALEKL